MKREGVLAGLSARALNLLRGDGAVVGLCILVLLLLVVRWAMRLPVDPGSLGTDTNDYLTLAAHRPPLYGWLLAAYRWATGGVAHLPILQLMLLSCALLIFAIELGRLLRSALAGAAAIVLMTRHVTIYDSPAIIGTETLYVALILAGLGMQFRHARRGGGSALAGAAICFALAAATRTTGIAFLLLPLIVALLDRRVRPRIALRRAGICTLAAALVLAVAVAGNWAKHRRAEIGSFAGIALLGKALVLLEPSDLEVMPPGSAATVPVAAEARRLTAAQPDLAARLRAHLQGSEDVRFASFFPEAEAHWPEWRDATWRNRSDLGLALASRLIERHPFGFTELWLRDWASLLLYPNYWPAWASADPPDPHAFLRCRLHANCWALMRYDISLYWLASMLAVSVGGAIIGLAVLLGAAPLVLRRRASAVIALCWTMGLVLHASLLLSSFAEAGFVRYTVGMHVLGTALLLWATVMAVRLFLRGRTVAGAATRNPRRTGFHHAYARASGRGGGAEAVVSGPNRPDRR
jgi:hypothetical protein